MAACSKNLAPGRAALLAVLLAGAASVAQAQPGKGKPRGTIQDAEIEIVKDRVNTLPEATRNFEKIKLVPPATPSRQVTYTYPDFRLPATRLNPSVQVLTIAQEEPEPLVGNYVKLGGGNYGTLYGRAHLHSVRNEQYSYGLDVRHQSSASGPVDGKNSAVAQTSLAATGEYYLGSAAVGASLDYARERYHFYGYGNDDALTGGPPSPLPAPDDIAQTFNRFGLRAYARNRAPDAKLQYEAGLGYKHWSNAYTAAEGNFLLDGKAGYALSEHSRLTLQANASFISEKETLPGTSGETTRGRNFVQATPAYELTGKTGLSLTLGATLGYSGEPLAGGGQPGGAGKGTVYPAVRVAYQAVPEKLQVYGGLGGAIQRVTLYDVTQENPWLSAGATQTVADTHYGPTAYLGFTSAPASGFELSARATVGRARNLYFYLNNPSQPSRFDLVYDSAALTVANVHADLLYNAAERWRAGLKADYNYYAVKALAHAYGRPPLQATLYGTYNVFDKMLLGADFTYYASNYGASYTIFDPGAGIFPTPQKTDAVVDLSLRAEYRVTPKFSIFALGNNLTNRHYQRFYNYPVKGINVIGGLAYQF